MDPRQVLNLAAALVVLYAGAETEVLRRVSRRLARGIEGPGWAEAKAAELAALRVELGRVVDRLDDAGPAQLSALIEQAHRAGARSAATALGEGLAIGTNRASLVALIEAGSATLRASHLAILRSASDVYRSTIAEAAGFGLTGVDTRRQTASRALARFADHGVSGFVDSRGRSWDLASYTEMATRSAIGQAHVSGHLTELATHGRDLVRISDSPDECPLCRPYEGRVFSISGFDPKYPALASARSGGLFHPGCTHGVAPWIPGLSWPFGRTADPIGESERARQRENERQIRHWRRREVVADGIGDERGAARARAKVAEWQASQRRFISDTGRRRDYRREQLGGPR